MKDPEFIQLRNRFLMALGLALIFTIPMILFIINRFNEKPSEVIEGIKNKENIIVLVTEDNCQACIKNKDILNKNNISFYEINKDNNKTTYELMLRKISMSSSDAPPPTIIYIEEGKLSSSLVNPNRDELQSYLAYNKFSKSN